MASKQQTVEQVYFFRKSKRETRRLHTATALLAYAIGITCVLPLFVMLKLLATRGVGWGRSPVVFLLLVAGYFFLLARRWLHCRQFKALTALPPEPTIRLACVGSPLQLERFGELADVPFEPALFSGTFVLPFNRTMRRVTLVLSILAIVALHLFLAYTTGRSVSDLLGGGGPALKIWGGSALAVCCVGWLWPTYFRIVPGRLDVIRFNNLRNRLVELWRIDLRTAKLLIDLRRGVIFIDDENGHELELPLAWMRPRTRERLAYHLLLAALSTHQTPMLPDDRLLG